MARSANSTFIQKETPSRPGRHAKSVNKRKPAKKKYRGQGRV